MTDAIIETMARAYFLTSLHPDDHHKFEELKDMWPEDWDEALKAGKDTYRALIEGGYVVVRREPDEQFDESFQIAMHQVWEDDGRQTIAEEGIWYPTTEEVMHCLGFALSRPSTFLEGREGGKPSGPLAPPSPAEDAATLAYTASRDHAPSTTVATPKSAAPDSKFFTVVFKGSVRRLNFNPLTAENPFGEIVAVGTGDALAKLDALLDPTDHQGEG